MQYKFKIRDRLKHKRKIGRVFRLSALNNSPSYAVKLEKVKRKKGVSNYSVWIESKVELLPWCDGSTAN